MATNRVVQTFKRIKENAQRTEQHQFSHNPWLDTQLGQIYVRYFMRHALEKTTYFQVLDLSNIKFKEQYKGRGFFGELLDELESFADENDIELRVSEISNDRLLSYLQRRPAWEIKVPVPDGWPTMIRYRKGKRDAAAEISLQKMAKAV